MKKKELLQNKCTEQMLWSQISSFKLNNPLHGMLEHAKFRNREHNHHSLMKMRVERMTAELAEKDQEIAELKRRLARRPDDATERLYESQLLIRKTR